MDNVLVGDLVVKSQVNCVSSVIPQVNIRMRTVSPMLQFILPISEVH